MQACAHRDRAAPDHLRDLLGAVALHIMQPYRRALLVRQRVYRLPQLAAALRRRRGGIGGSLHRRGAPEPRRTAQIRASAERHPQQPRLEVLRITEIGVVPQQPEKHLLIDVLCIGAAVQAAQRQPIDRITAGIHRLL